MYNQYDPAARRGGTQWQNGNYSGDKGKSTAVQRWSNIKQNIGEIVNSPDSTYSGKHSKKSKHKWMNNSSESLNRATSVSSHGKMKHKGLKSRMKKLNVIHAFMNAKNNKERPMQQPIHNTIITNQQQLGMKSNSVLNGLRDKVKSAHEAPLQHQRVNRLTHFQDTNSTISELSDDSDGSSNDDRDKSPFTFNDPPFPMQQKTLQTSRVPEIDLNTPPSVVKGADGRTKKLKHAYYSIPVGSTTPEPRSMDNSKSNLKEPVPAANSVPTNKTANANKASNNDTLKQKKLSLLKQWGIDSATLDKFNEHRRANTSNAGKFRPSSRSLDVKNERRLRALRERIKSRENDVEQLDQRIEMLLTSTQSKMQTLGQDVKNLEDDFSHFENMMKQKVKKIKEEEQKLKLKLENELEKKIQQRISVKEQGYYDSLAQLQNQIKELSDQSLNGNSFWETTMHSTISLAISGAGTIISVLAGSYKVFEWLLLLPFGGARKEAVPPILMSQSSIASVESRPRNRRNNFSD